MTYADGYANIANANPFRYRGYYWDAETGFYYLQSRYYDPATGRFLNADIHINANGDLIGYNMYAYCSNNPVMFTDPSGEGFLTILAIIGISAIVGSALSILNAACTGEDLGSAAIEGFITGAASATIGLFLGPAEAFVIGTLVGGTVSFASQSINQMKNDGSFNINKINWKNVVKTGLTTGVSSAIPSFGKGYDTLINAFGTIVAWGEASILITVTDIVISAVFEQINQRSGLNETKNCISNSLYSLQGV